jgi:dUTP pyrophosphatase
MTTVTVKIVLLNEAAQLPKYGTDGSACVDLCANIKEPIEIACNRRILIPTGVKIGLPAGYEAQVRPRSGLALKHGISVYNTPGTIDSDYTGEISVILINLNDKAFIIEPHMRVAQLLVMPVPKIIWQEVDDLDITVRGNGGYGSTGY